MHELKEIDVLHYPERGRRALTTLGMEADEERVSKLRATFEASKSSSAKEQTNDRQRKEPPTAWRIRAGGGGERYDYNIEHGLACLGFGDHADLRKFSSKQDLLDELRRLPEYGGTNISSSANQLWRMRSEVRLGDLVVMPSKRMQQVALGTVTREYWYDDSVDVDWGRHVVSVDWKREVPGTDLKQDLQASISGQLSICSIARNDGAWRLQQLMETGQDPGARLDLAALVDQFLDESGYPTEAHEAQKRLRREWAEKLSAENVASLTREDLTAFTNNAVRPGEYVHPVMGVMQWILDLGDDQYRKLLDNIHDLCWGTDDLSARIDRLVDWTGSRRDTGTKNFAGWHVSTTLAICHPDRFLPVHGQEGAWGRTHMLRRLGLPEPQGSTFGQHVVDANDRLREHLASHLDDDPQSIAGFLYWLRRQETDPNGGDEPRGETSDLAVLIEQFRAETNYPTEAHEEQKQLRAEWAEKLAPENIANLSRLDLTAVASRGTWHAGTYVYPHAQGVMKWIRALDGDEYAGMLDHIRYLCWDEDEMWRRYDQLTDSTSDRRTKGLVHSTTSRLLAISHPQDFLAIGVQGGKWGRAAMLRRLGLPKPAGSSYGQRVMDADRRLREHLEPHFGDDTLGMGAFVGWMLVQKPPVPNGTENPIDPGELEELADELLVDAEFLEDIVELLKDKGQVILYGPPGTGKTYLARELAEVLAPDESRRALVQFHPSTSYEDFFEGYRPAGADDGRISYKLTFGPLARMADMASNAPGQRHVMIIDEINRGNLPRVLGELLFLLEYRSESARTLYRPEEPFSLPDNLWFIGTMNTADRSIALVDAALRRRFHFVPFFPDSGPIAGLLARWLEREDQPDWIARLVDAVNDELTKELGGSHLLLGPSHFMKQYGSSPDKQRHRLRRIWMYNIEPFIEDQFFGDLGRIEHFRFDAVMRRKGPAAESDTGTGDDGEDLESTDGSEREHAAGDGEATAEPGSTQPGDGR